MVDYSKWNNMDVSDSEREESEEDFGPPSPKVTRFDTEQQVTFGGGRSEIQARSAIEWNRALEADWTRNGGYYEPPSASPSPSSCPGREQEDLTGCVVPYYWSQNQREKFSERGLWIVPLMEKELRWTYEVVTDDEDEIDWVFEYGSGEKNKGIKGQKYLKLTVQKKSMITGSVFWWRAAFKGHPELQPEDIQDRSKKNIEKQKEFYNRMEEATRLFKDKVRKRNGAAILPDGVPDMPFCTTATD
eukprot:g1387.t1